MGPAEFRIIENCLHKGLAIIKIASHTHRSDISAKSGHLGLLQRAHLAFGIEHHHPGAWNIEEPGCNCTACVSRSGGENGQIVSFRVEQAEHPTHKSGSEVLECASG